MGYRCPGGGCLTFSSAAAGPLHRNPYQVLFACMWRPIISSNSSASICCTASSRCHQSQQPVMRRIPGVEKNITVTMKASVLVRHHNKELTWLLAYLLTQWCRKQFKGEGAHFPAQSAGKNFFVVPPLCTMDGAQVYAEVAHIICRTLWYSV